ncbi:carbohydrate-selective porin OprB [Parvibaculum indicum]|uniref:carbohydrate porin n=1 Tax=Parvibaculum indicum TaxID=562969 RepID=UPI0014231596|nr:carbohydrate porin [Parvibaculum indicum]NIJ41515.1 carbohydrate-selective porin OprB [Parvibaculum indicum]
MRADLFPPVRAGASDLGAGFSDETNAELYARYDAVENLHITPLVQWANNPGFDDTGLAVDESVVIFGLRVGVDI